MKKTLITGISGFAGSFLADHLIAENKTEVWGSYINETSLVNVQGIKDKLSLVTLNLLDEKNTSEVLGKIRPDYIFHLAALTSAKDSFDSPANTLQNNIKAQINVLEAVRKLGYSETRILIISSAEVYGLVKKIDLPVDEETPFMPTNPYAVSKLTQDFLGLQYFLSYNLKIIRARPFNHIGPRQTDKFVIGAFAKKIAEIEKGKRKPMLPVGNLDTKRDFTDVRDMIKAYSILIDKGKEGEVYNIGTGRSYQISEILNKLLLLSNTKIEIRVDEKLLRPSDNPELLCDTSKFYGISHWKPEIPIEKTLKDILDYWRNII